VHRNILDGTMLLLIRVTTFIDEDQCIVSSKTFLYIEDQHQGSKRLYM